MTHRAAGAVGRRRSARAGCAKRGLLRGLPGQLRPVTAQRETRHTGRLCVTPTQNLSALLLLLPLLLRQIISSLLPPFAFLLSPLLSPASPLSSVLSRRGRCRQTAAPGTPAVPTSKRWSLGDFTVSVSSDNRRISRVASTAEGLVGCKGLPWPLQGSYAQNQSQIRIRITISSILTLPAGCGGG